VLRKMLSPAVALLLTAGMSAATVGAADGNDRPPGTDAGPPYKFITELMREALATPLKNQAMLTGTLHGYRFRTGPAGQPPRSDTRGTRAPLRRQRHHQVEEAVALLRPEVREGGSGGRVSR
jgi:hypothetical protein